ncbi:MAG: PEP-CTERM sorting domain-containing protein [Luteolibacter sp.]
MKLNKTLLVFSALAVGTFQLNAATVIALTADDANSSLGRTVDGAGVNVGITATLSDTFAYDPNDPIAVTPDFNYAEDTGVTPNTTNAYHANGSTPSPSMFYDLSHTMALNEVLYFDAYGRSGNGGNRQLRDNDYSVILYSGGGVVATVNAQGIPDSGTRHNRTEFAGITPGTTIDRVEVIGNNSNQFTLMEVRMAVDTVPEPSSAALLGLAGMTLLLRRRK